MSKFPDAHPPTGSIPSQITQMRYELDALESVAARVEEQRSALILQQVALEIKRQHADATAFRIRSRLDDPLVWELQMLLDENGDPSGSLSR